MSKDVSMRDEYNTILGKIVNLFVKGANYMAEVWGTGYRDSYGRSVMITLDPWIKRDGNIVFGKDAYLRIGFDGSFRIVHSNTCLFNHKEHFHSVIFAWLPGVHSGELYKELYKIKARLGRILQNRTWKEIEGYYIFVEDDWDEYRFLREELGDVLDACGWNPFYLETAARHPVNTNVRHHR